VGFIGVDIPSRNGVGINGASVDRFSRPHPLPRLYIIVTAVPVPESSDTSFRVCPPPPHAAQQFLKKHKIVPALMVRAVCKYY
jgi:hypothetical protein